MSKRKLGNPPSERGLSPKPKYSRAWMILNRDQLWAEAYHYLKLGDPEQFAKLLILADKYPELKPKILEEIDCA